MISDPGDWSLELLEQSLDDLGWLWSQRAASWARAGLTLLGLARLDERIDAHTDALALAGQEAAPLLLEGLAKEEPSEVLAAALPLLRAEIVEPVADALASASSPRLDALASASAYGLMERRSGLRLSAAARTALERAAARQPAWWLWMRGAAGDPPALAELRTFLGDRQAEVRALAWRTVATTSVGPLDLRHELGQALGDEQAVRAAALEACAWTRQKDLPALLRSLSASAGPARADALRVLCVLGGAEALPLVETALRDERLGPRRFELAGRLGNPALVNALLPVIGGGDAEAALAAGRAFERVTGVRLPTDRTGQVGDPEASEEVELPDATEAARAWASLAPGLSAATRVEQGIAVASGLPSALAEVIDLPGYAEARMRDAFLGNAPGSPAELQRFPWPGA